MQILIDYTIDTEFQIKFDEKFFTSIINIILTHLEVEPNIELSILLTDDAQIKELNAQYRGKDYATDVLSFPMDDTRMLGDIVISIDTAKRQAEDAEITLNREVAFLFIHGFLHLLGYDHELDEADAEDMYDLQESILAQWEESLV